MAASTNDINSYLYNIECAHSDFGAQVANYEKLGRTGIQIYKVKLLLLGHLVSVMQDFFNTPNYLTNNFYTTIQILPIIDGINNICGTEYTLNL